MWKSFFLTELHKICCIWNKGTCFTPKSILKARNMTNAIPLKNWDTLHYCFLQSSVSLYSPHNWIKRDCWTATVKWNFWPVIHLTGRMMERLTCSACGWLKGIQALLWRGNGVVTWSVHSMCLQQNKNSIIHPSIREMLKCHSPK